MIERHRELTVGTQLAADDGGYQFFVGWSEAEATTMAIFQSHKLRAVIVPTARFVPQLTRLQCRHENLMSTDSIHLFTHDVLDLGKDAHAQGQ